MRGRGGTLNAGASASAGAVSSSIRRRAIPLPAILGAAAVMVAAFAHLVGPAASTMVGTAFFALGLPHGAGDEQHDGLRAFTLGEVAAYCVAGLAAAAFILTAPVAGLVLFLALSAWHFAHDRRRHALPVALGSALLLVGGSALFRPQRTGAIFALLIGGPVPAPVTLALAMAGAAGVALALLAAWREPAARPPAALAVVAPAAFDPVLATGLLFLIIHAGPAQVQQLRRFGPRTVLRAVGIPTLIAATGAGVGAMLVADGTLPLPVLAAVAGGMTLPHLLTLRL